MQFHRILIPIDFSLGSAHALDYGAELATHFDASLTVLHAYQLPSFALPDGAIMATPGLVTRITDHAAEAMESFVEPLGETDIKVEALLREGRRSLQAVLARLQVHALPLEAHERPLLVDWDTPEDVKGEGRR